MSEYFPKPKALEANVKVDIDLSNYATKAHFKNATGFDTSSFAKKADLVNLKSDVDKLKDVRSNSSNLKSKVNELDIHKLATVPVDLSELSDAIKIDIVKKDVYNARIKNIEDKIPDIANLDTNTTLHSKINEIKNKIPNINSLATTTVLLLLLVLLLATTAVENKLPNVINFVKKLIM